MMMTDKVDGSSGSKMFRKKEDAQAFKDALPGNVVGELFYLPFPGAYQVEWRLFANMTDAMVDNVSDAMFGSQEDDDQ